MTLDWNKTADNHTLIQALRPLLADRLWIGPYDLKWYARRHDGTWQAKASLTHYWPHFAWAADQLPTDDYWARSRHRLQTFYSIRQIAGLLRHDCWRNGCWSKPGDLNA